MTARIAFLFFTPKQNQNRLNGEGTHYLPEEDAPHVYVPASLLRYFVLLVSSQTFRGALIASGDRCAEIRCSEIVLWGLFSAMSTSCLHRSSPPPGTEITPPGTEITPPGTEITPPGTEITPPGTEITPPKAAGGLCGGIDE